MRTVAVLALDGVIAFDLATPIEVFGRTRAADGSRAYQVLVAGPETIVTAGPTSLTVPTGLDRLVTADTVVVPGRDDPERPLDPRAIDALQAAAGRGARIASICVGALDLAASGLLDGLRATTHWAAAGLLAARHPLVEVDAKALFVDNGRILCSAGATAGIDLCLHMIARDHGGLVAADAARTAVMPLTRDAGQAQFIRNDELGPATLGATLDWIERHAHEPLTVADIAASASVSDRTLHRRFAQELGLTPGDWLARVRVQHAQRLLETTDWSMDRIAHDVGLGSAANLRARFTDRLGTSPSRYRTALTSRSTTSGSAPGADPGETAAVQAYTQGTRLPIRSEEKNRARVSRTAAVTAVPTA